MSYLLALPKRQARSVRHKRASYIQARRIIKCQSVYFRVIQAREVILGQPVHQDFKDLVEKLVPAVREVQTEKM